ncbi:hypothetical protein DYB32_010459 [Aphanomyces invadans]|uniref:Uncharacterized protein n=1 Tax=Aphanomyces invadans TaxID=157072 RepID=A0A3R6ZH18_9STRA|nr:hypothetical protein DYB32_010459 [Aphanomyces invadans]
MDVGVNCGAKRKEATTVNAKLQRKRSYNRERLRHKTLAYKADVLALTTEIDQLRATLAAMMFDRKETQLPWQDVPQVFLSDRAMVEYQLKCLSKQVVDQDKLNRIMMQWLTTSQTPIHVTSFMGGIYLTRPQCSDHSTPIRVAVSMTPYYRVAVHEGEDQSYYVLEEYKQRVEPMALALVSSILHRMYFEFVDGDQVDDAQGDKLRYLRYASLYGRARNQIFHENMLVRAFDDPVHSRYVIFTHSISDDSKYPQDIQSDWTAWLGTTKLEEDPDCFEGSSLKLCLPQKQSSNTATSQMDCGGDPDPLLWKKNVQL